MPKVTLGPITRHAGIAGQISFTVTAHYPDEPASSVEFVGSEAYGGPVVMITPGNPKGVFVRNPGRFGEFGKDWVTRFFADQD